MNIRNTKCLYRQNYSSFYKYKYNNLIINKAYHQVFLLSHLCVNIYIYTVYINILTYIHLRLPIRIGYYAHCHVSSCSEDGLGLVITGVQFNLYRSIHGRSIARLNVNRTRKCLCRLRQ